MIHLIIDGYNYIHRTRTSKAVDGSSLEMYRRELLERLFRYKKDRSVHITTVFDARGGYNLGRQRENHRGIDVVFAGDGETADDVMIQWIREGQAGAIVVSSDRAIIDEAKKAGIPFMTPVALEQTMAGGTAELSEKEDYGEFHRPKTGNPRKLPKRLRKVTRSISKIKL